MPEWPALRAWILFRLSPMGNEAIWETPVQTIMDLLHLAHSFSGCSVGD